MIKITIGSEERDISNATSEWIKTQIDRRRADGANVCIKVTIRKPGIDMILTTADCPTGGGGRKPKELEIKILELWAKCRLNLPHFNAVDVADFLRNLH